MTTSRLLSILVMVLTLSIPFATARGQATPTYESAPEIAQRYALDVNFDPETATIAGEMRVRWTNTTGEPQETLPFRLYPNASYYGDGGIELGEVTVEGDPVQPELDAVDPTVMRVPIPSTAPGEEIVLTLPFSTIVPVDTNGSFGIFRGNSTDGSWALVNWYPIVAGWEPGKGWFLDPPRSLGDPTFVTASAWDVTISHPDTHVLIGTGDETTTVAAGIATTTIDLPVGRELAVVALPAGSVTTTVATIGNQDVQVTLPVDDAVPGMAEALETFAGEALPRYGEWFGGPVERELDITVANLDGALGVSWTGAVWLDLDQLTADGVLDDVERMSLRFVVHHEIGHQWMAGMIGTNSNNHTFLTEGLVNVLAVAIVRDIDGPQMAAYVFNGWVAGPYRAFVNGGQDAIADSPVGELSPTVHSFVTYGKGGVGFEAIRQEIGDDAFFEALEYLGTTYAWGIVTPEILLGAFEQASGIELDDLWASWFERAEATLPQVDAVIAGAGQ